jgi:hypothetical protein
MVSTKELKFILRKYPLSFLIPGELTNNYITPLRRSYDPIPKKIKKKPYNLRVTVYPKKNEKEQHDVFINGTHQYKLIPGSLDYLSWVKHTKDVTPWFQNFGTDWRYLLGLNDPEPTPDGYNFLGNYLISKLPNLFKKHNTRHYEGHCGKMYTDITPMGNKVYLRIPKTIQIPQPYKKGRVQQIMAVKGKNDHSVFVKDLNTNRIEKMSMTEAFSLVSQGSHYDYCFKREWKNQEGLCEHKNDYWIKIIERDEDGNPIKDESLKGYYRPKVEQHIPVKLKYLVRNRKLISSEVTKKPSKKQKLYDRDAKHQLIVVMPKLKKVIYKKDNVKYNKETITRKLKTKDKDGNIIGTVITKPNKRFNKLFKEKVVDYNKSEPTIEEFIMPVYIPEYEYIPMVFKSNKHPEPIIILGKDGEPLMVKIFKKLSKESVTIKTPSRITYKTIVTKQYPSELGKKRGIIKKNIAMLQKQEEERKQKEKEQKTE